MVSKVSFLMGAGVGYLLGARAGRQRYDQIVTQAQRLWQDPRVQRKADQAQHLAKEKGAAAASAAAEKAAQSDSTMASRAGEKVQEKLGDTGSTPGTGPSPGTGTSTGTSTSTGTGTTPGTGPAGGIR